jgi:adenylate kinase
VLTEEEFRRRKPHPNYKNQTEVEKAVIKMGKDGPFKAYVVVPGLVYHAGDSIFHPYFKV